MTDKEKIEKLDFLEDLFNRTGASFGSEDLIFAGHPEDEKRAKAFIKDAKKKNVSRGEFENILIGFLYRRNCSREHIDTQVEKFRKLFK